MKVSHDREIETRLAERVVRQQSRMPRHEYLVQWKGQSIHEATWELDEELWQGHIDYFHKGKATRASPE